ncbi:MAG TPA: pitrilysin family protein [Kofleriaceae bacterium]
MKTVVAALALVALTAGAVAAPWDKSGITDWTKAPAAAAEPTFTPPTPHRMRLANGMALLVIENHKLPIVSMSLVVPNAGSATDPKGKPGLASFTADLLDEGAGGLSAIQIAEEEDRLGASIGVYAGIDSAGIAVGTLAKTLDPTIDLVAKILTAPAFDQKDFSRVQGDRATALELRRDRPREVASLLLGGALYGLESPYGHPSSGFRESFKTIALADVTAYYKDRWDPKGMTLVVAGDVDPIALQKKLDATVGAWKHAGKHISKVTTTPVAKIAHRLLVVDRPGSQQSDVRVGLVGLDRKDPRFYAFEVMTTTLGGGFTSRLNQKLREQLGITYGIRASQDWRLDRGPFTISSALVTAETAHGLAETIKIVDEIATVDVPDAELDKSKQNLIRALPAQFETNAATAEAFAELALHGLPDSWYAHYSDQIRKVTAKDVRTVAKTAIPAKQMVFAVVGDMAKVRADLDKLNLGDAETRDLYGMPIAK